MASAKKINVSKHESEIDKLRNENKWDKLRDYSTSLLKNKDSKYGKLLNNSTASPSWHLFNR